MKQPRRRRRLHRSWWDEVNPIPAAPKLRNTLPVRVRVRSVQHVSLGTKSPASCTSGIDTSGPERLLRHPSQGPILVPRCSLRTSPKNNKCASNKKTLSVDSSILILRLKGTAFDCNPRGYVNVK